jgi:AraC-like DNA-binding protein/quercetin dioxygenase-like cupin family protein
MHDLSLYETKIINDEEFPVQMFMNQIRTPGNYCPAHWHQHIELHYVFKGKGVISCNQKNYTVEQGSLVIINSNELHEGISITDEFDALVIIFEMKAFSKEIASFNVIFQSLVQGDKKIEEKILSIYQEEIEKGFGYKVAMKGMIYELITYLLRNYVVESLTIKENNMRRKNLTRLNTVLQYISTNYKEQITIKQLAELIHLSEYRFCHLFKESIGQSPLNYINEVRLTKAHRLLEQKELSVTEVAEYVGFTDYNNFGRLFRKYYSYAPSRVWK